MTSTALPESQATLVCAGKAKLYTIDMSIGKRIRAARLRRGLIQEKLAKKLGLKKQSVSQWENDSDHPKPESLLGLVKELRVPFVWLMEGPGVEPPPMDDVVSRLETLSAEQMLTVIAVIDSFEKRRTAG